MPPGKIRHQFFTGSPNLSKKVNFFTDDTDLLKLFSVKVAGLHQYFRGTIPEEKYKVKTKQR